MTNKAYKRTLPPTKGAGGKFYIADKIVALFPPRNKYLLFCEPYVGTGAVLFAHDPTGKAEVVGDLNLGITNFFKTLQQQNTFAQFCQRVATTPFSEFEWRQAVDRERLLLDDPDVGKAVQFFLATQLSHGGSGKSPAIWTKRRLRSGILEQTSAWLAKIDNLPAVHARLMRVGIACPGPVKIYHGQALQLLERVNATTTVAYIDPPYVHSTRTTDDHYGQFEMTDEQHEELLTYLFNDFRGYVLLSSYDNPLYNSVLKGWYKVAIAQPLHSSKKATKEVRHEIVYRNFA